MSIINVIQFRRRADLIEAEQKSYAREASACGAMLAFTDVFDDSIPWDNPKKVFNESAGVILAGSGEIDFNGGRTASDPARQAAGFIFDRMQPTVDFLLSHNIPTLGICFGHQIMGKHLGAAVVHEAAHAKVGSHSVTREKGDTHSLFAGTPESFFAQYGHKDSLDRKPRGTRVLAAGDRCPYSAIQYTPHAYSVQFHPELNADDIKTRLAQSPGYLPEDVSADDIVYETPAATRLLHNFFRVNCEHAYIV